MKHHRAGICPTRSTQLAARATEWERQNIIVEEIAHPAEPPALKSVLPPAQKPGKGFAVFDPQLDMWHKFKVGNEAQEWVFKRTGRLACPGYLSNCVRQHCRCFGFKVRRLTQEESAGLDMVLA